MHIIDAFIIEKIYAENFKREGIAIDYLPQTLGDVQLSYIFPKTERGQTLCNQTDEFIDKVTANGELDALKNKWLFGDKSGRTFTRADGLNKICMGIAQP